MRDLQEEREKKVKLLKKSLIITGIILVILVLMLIALKVLDSNRSKVLLNNEEISIERITYNFGDKTYVNLREMAKFFPSFRYSTGEYSKNGTVNQDPNYFHLSSPYEIIQFKKESDNMIKYILVDQNYYQFDSKGARILSKEEKESGKNTVIERQEIDNKIRLKEEFRLASEVLEINNNQFIPLEDIKYIFNLSLTETANKIELYTVEYLERVYASYLNRSNLSLNPNYQNRRAIIDGYFIVSANSTNPIYGVQIFENGSFRSQISESYKDIRYVQNNKTIFVINNQNAFGLINIDKATDIIQPGLYDTIEAYLPELDLYQVKNVEGKYGIIDTSGDTVKVVVHLEYDEIGYDTSKFLTETTGKIFFNSLIPAKKGNRWFIFDLKNPGKNYGSAFGGYMDLGYKKPELLSRNSSNQPQLTNDQIKELENRGFSNLTREDRNATEEDKNRRIALLAREGFVLNSNAIPEGESILTVPESTGFGGLIVKDYLANDYVYYVINSNPEVRAKGSPYSPLNAPYKRIYKLSVDGTERYYAIDASNIKYELRKEKEKPKEENLNIINNE